MAPLFRGEGGSEEEVWHVYVLDSHRSLAMTDHRARPSRQRIYNGFTSPYDRLHPIYPLTSITPAISIYSPTHLLPPKSSIPSQINPPTAHSHQALSPPHSPPSPPPTSQEHNNQHNGIPNHLFHPRIRSIHLRRSIRPLQPHLRPLLLLPRHPRAHP